MPRGIRGKSKFPASDGRPRGLKGKELGLYYKQKQLDNEYKKGRKPFVIRLKVPETVVAALHNNIKCIEEIAVKEGIYLEPVKELKFVKPNTDGADFIPLQASDWEKESHHVTNIIPKDNDVIFVSKNKTSVRDDDVVYVTTAQYEPVSIESDDAIEVTLSDYDSKILLDDENDIKPKKAKANAAMDLNIDTDRKPSRFDFKHYYKSYNDTVSRTVADSDSIVESNFDPIMKVKTKVKPVAGHSSTKPSTSDMKPNYELKKETVSSTDADSDAYKRLIASIKHDASCSNTKLNDVILLDDHDEDIKPSTSDMKPNYELKKETVSSTDADSDAYKRLIASIKHDASCSNTKLNDVILLDDHDEDIKPSTSDMKPNYELKKETVSSTDADSDAYKRLIAKIEHVASCSNTKLNDVILLDDHDEDIKPSTSDMKPNYELKKETVSSTDAQQEKEYTASTSSLKDSSDTERKEYKYGYEDIVTAKFEDKLDESLAKGIEINIKNDTTSKLSKELLDKYNIMKEQRKYNEMKTFRQILPTYRMAEELLDVVNNNQVVVISGETGCGKSTQVPQIILDDAIKNKRGANVNILVTEPRRIAASSLAMRVAEERAEATGESVGYTVRLERVECRPRGSIMFCTTGVLLVELEVNQSLSNYTHIILDEVHERDCQIDISMCMLRQVLKKRKDLKLILMSATIDSESLSTYFDNCPMLHIKGLAYPVKDVYLEEILHMTRYRLPPVNTKPYNTEDKRPWIKHLRKVKSQASNMEKDILYRAEIGPWLESIRKMIDRDVYLTLQDRRIEDLDVNLLLQLLLCVSRSDPGAILVFLPGIGDITKLIRLMYESQMFPSSHFEIHPLHSKLPTLTQHKIFRRPPGNIRKIIVATNIAETSITIDDIVYVVDCAKVKYKGLNVKDHVSTLQTEWASQANLRQRRGRAGRCQPGICYHLVTSFRASKLEERPLPELQRDDLLEPVLQIKRLRLGLAAQALGMMPAVPHETTIYNAVRHLQQCGALDQRETLTPLGWHLARLPVHPAAGKLLLLGALFGCLERAASVAAIWGFKDPFQLVIGKEREVDEAKKNLALGEPSDHVAMSEALIQWDNLESYSEKNHFAREYYLSTSTLKLLSSMKNQFGQNLKQMGFLRSGNVKSEWVNRNSDNLALFKAIVAAALYPNIGSVRWRTPRNANPNRHPYIKVRTAEGTPVQIHPSSVMASKEDRNRRYKSMPLCANPGANWLVYWLKQRSTNLFLIDVTLVFTLPLLFFGEFNVTQGDTRDECLIDINTVKVCCDRETTLLLFRLRSLLDQVLASKIRASGEGKRSSVFEEEVLNAVKCLITAEDARTEYMADDDHSDSDSFNDGRSWY